jgi:hypothetical protein
MLIVGISHGGHGSMMPWDPALKNEISPVGKVVVKFAFITFISSAALAFILLSMMSPRS